ncbi:hypothetical protein [Hymenobacter saemangeumensis]|uniref:hypothetical protein n=1 Tax=Hymenobacter saemangeumensis TaxID=1084522 RepID=UPI0031ED0CA0
MYAVLPLAENDNIFKNSQAVGLTKAEIMVVDSLLNKAINEHNQVQEEEFQDMTKAHPEIPFRKENYFISLPGYKRQLIAAVNSKGEKEVWVNCFCTNNKKWRWQMVYVMDGGNCYFNLKINLAKKSWYDFMVNGLA